MAKRKTVRVQLGISAGSGEELTAKEITMLRRKITGAIKMAFSRTKDDCALCYRIVQYPPVRNG